MAPDSQCLSREGVVETPKSFMTRVMALPAIDQAATMYRYTKEQQPYVGVALSLAEAGIMRTVTATGAIIPMATPIANHVDVLACQVLDNVVKVAPIITKPTDEIVDGTRHFVMKSIAGGQHHSKSLTLKTALVARASDVVYRASDTNYGRALIQIAESVLHSAHHAVDTYLPPAEGDIDHADGFDGDISSKAFSLAYKTQGRLKRTTMSMLNNNYENDDEDINIIPLHQIGSGNHQTLKWHYSLHDIPYVRKAAHVTNTAQTVVIKNIGFLFKNTVIFIKTNIQSARNVLSSMTLNGMNTARHWTSRSIVLGKDMKMAVVDTMNYTRYKIRFLFHSAFTGALLATNTIKNSSKSIMKSTVNTGLTIRHRAMDYLANALSNLQVSTKSKKLLGTAEVSLNYLKAQGIITFFVVKQYSEDIFVKIFLAIPPSLYITGHNLYIKVFSLGSTFSQYPAQGIRTSSQMLESVRHIPMDSYVWLRNKDLTHQVYLLIVIFQSQIASLMKNIRMNSDKVKLS